MKRSPIQFDNLSPEMKKLAIETRMMSELIRVHQELMGGVAGVKSIAEEARRITAAVFREQARIQSLPKGDKGDRGPRGADGKDGKPGAKGDKGDKGDPGSSPELETIVASVIARIREPQDGKDAAVDYDLLSNMVIEKILAEKKLKKEHIDGFEAEMASYRNQLAGKHYGKDTWARGGGDTVVAGQNVTISTNANGQKVINASGGGSGNDVTTQYSLTAVQSGADVTIDLTQLTNWATFVALIQVQRNNIPQTETLNFTLVGSTLTVLKADAGEVFNVVYAYA